MTPSFQFNVVKNKNDSQLCAIAQRGGVFFDELFKSWKI